MIEHYELKIRHTFDKWAMNDEIYFNFTKCLQTVFYLLMSIVYISHKKLKESLRNDMELDGKSSFSNDKLFKWLRK